MAARQSNTELAKQLERLKSQQVVEYEHFDIRKRLSVLFEFTEAAEVDDETIYAIGANGLQGLINANKKSFEEFQRDLFHLDSQNVYRSQLTQDENQAISQRIRCFLLRLCPYLMLKASFKCLEWLIRRYSIHLFNTDDIMACILPYHQSNQFVRILQVLPITQQRSRWNWLKNNRINSVPLSSTALQQRCITDLSVLKLICNCVQDALKYNAYANSTALINLYTSVVVGVFDLSHPDNITQQLMITLTPYLLKGLKSNHDELVAATYIIITQMMMKMTFDKKYTSMLMDRITKVHDQPYIVYNTCIDIIFQCLSSRTIL